MKKQIFGKFFLILFLLAFSFSSFSVGRNIFASSVEELKKQIEESNKKIAEIEEEIKKYEGEINKTSAESDSLKKQIKSLELTRNKLASDIKLTTKQVEVASTNIERIGMEINFKTRKIEEKKEALVKTIKSVNESESMSLVEIILSNGSLSDYFGEIENMQDFQKEINKNLEELKLLKESLEVEKGESEAEKKKLNQSKTKLVDQKKLVEINKTGKNNLLVETKNKESNYKKILAEKKKLKEAFENEIMEFESKLRVIIDPASLPPSGSGVLKWPLSNIFITQKFGVTADSKRLYTSGSHNGVDFRASQGTKVMSAGKGTVVGTGDTDQTCSGASFGKWVLIDFHNGLSAIFAHLSLIKVSPGQEVNMGEIIGYSGNTGYSTGPHLHVTVYASKGVQIQTRPSKVCSGKSYTMPLAPLNAYLDPLLYF